MSSFSFIRGEPLRIMLEVVSGDPAGYAVTECIARPKPEWRASPLSNAPETPLAISIVQGGWLFELTGLQTAALGEDFYQIVATMTLNGSPFPTRPVVVGMRDA